MDDQTVVASGWSAGKLVVRQGVQAGKSFPLGRQAVVLGREESADIALQDAEMSRRHASVSWGEGHYVLEDLRSTNGTYLNGTMIRAPQQLKHGDTIGVGQTVLEFEWPAAARAAQLASESPGYSAPPPPPSAPPQPAYEAPRYSAPPPPPLPPPPPPAQPIYEAPRYSAPPPQPVYEAPRYSAPPPAPPAVQEQPKPGRSRCLLIGCGCLVVLVLLVVGAFAVVMFAMPERLKEIQRMLDQNNVPIQLTMATLRSLMA